MWYTFGVGCFDLVLLLLRLICEVVLAVVGLCYVLLAYDFWDVVLCICVSECVIVVLGFWDSGSGWFCECGVYSCVFKLFVELLLVVVVLCFDFFGVDLSFVRVLWIVADVFVCV